MASSSSSAASIVRALTSSCRGIVVLTVGAVISSKSSFGDIDDEHDISCHNGSSSSSLRDQCNPRVGSSSSSLSEIPDLRLSSSIGQVAAAPSRSPQDDDNDGGSKQLSQLSSLAQLRRRLQEVMTMESLNMKNYSHNNTNRTFCDDYVRLHRALNKGLKESDSEEDKEMVEGGETEEHTLDHHQHCDEFDVYPNFSRHGKNALLPQYLTPEVFERLRWKQTPNGVTLEDIIRSGVALPGGAHPPRGLAGVYAGDADSYRVFHSLFDPLIRDYHHQSDKNNKESLQQQHQQQRKSRVKLQRHQTDLNFNLLLQDTLDPEGEYILYTRMRLARSISGFRFSPCIRRGERQEVETLLKDCVKEWPGGYVSVMQMTNSQHENLIQQHILFNDPDEFLVSAGFGRDWPDGRGIYCDTWQDTPAIIMWCNAEDHLWLISHGKGGNVQGVFTKLSKAVNALEFALKERNRSFVEDRKYGFLNTSPANIGTALRASVYVKLVHLSRQPGFFDLVHRLRLEARSEYSQSDRRFTGIFDIANSEALGKSEVDLINIMIRGVGFLIELEKKLERNEQVDLNSIAAPETHSN